MVKVQPPNRTLSNDKLPTGHPRAEFTVHLNRCKLAHKVEPAETPSVDSEPIPGREDDLPTPAFKARRQAKKDRFKDWCDRNSKEERTKDWCKDQSEVKVEPAKLPARKYDLRPRR